MKKLVAMRRSFIAFLLVLMLMIFAIPALADSPRIGKLSSTDSEVADVLKTREAYIESGAKDSADKTFVSYPSLTELLLAMNRGDVNYAVVPMVNAAYIARQNPSVALVETAVLYYNCMAVLPENGALCSAISQAIIDMRQDGMLDALETAYLQTSDDPQPVAITHIDDADTLSVGVTGDCPPMDLILADGTPAGYNVALLAELSEHLHMNIELVSVSAEARLTALASGKIDVIFWARSFTDAEYAEGDAMCLTESYYTCPAALISSSMTAEEIRAAEGLDE